MDMSAEQSNEQLFQGLVISLAAATMQHLGKTLNPMTNKIDKNMQAAQSTIDMLDMLEAKTRAIGRIRGEAAQERAGGVEVELRGDAEREAGGAGGREAPEQAG
jgi:hypothetical protein